MSTSSSQLCLSEKVDAAGPLAVAPARVLHVVDMLAPGGTQIVLKAYLESRACDDRLHLYGLRRVPNQINIAHPNVSVEPSPSRFALAPLMRLRSIIRSRGIEIIYCHLFRAQVFGYLLKTLFFPRLVLVFHEHGRIVGRERESRFEAMAFRLFLRAAWRSVRFFVCISDHTRARLLDEIPGAASRAVVVGNPVRISSDDPSGRDRSALRRDVGVPDKAFVVGFAARLIERKGWRDFLRAMQVLATRIPLYFLIAGDGEDRLQVDCLMRTLGLDHHGKLLGHVTNMGDFYRALDCLVIPSHWEPHGLTHLEAQSCGVPVVVSNVPGLSDTVHAGVDALLVESGDSSALAEAVFQIASDTTLRWRLSKAGPANAARFAVEPFARELDEIYRRARSGEIGTHGLL